MKYGTPLARLLATCCSLVAIVALSGNTGASCSGGGRADTSCVTAADCEGLGQPKCDGQWACLANECVFDCQLDPPPVTCLQSGCSGEVCGPAGGLPSATSCEWKDWFGCLGLTKCGAFNADGSCGFDPNAEFLACVEKASGCLSNADCPAGFQCLVTDDCGGYEDCVGAAGQCSKLPDHTGCIDDTQCAPGERCVVASSCGTCGAGMNCVMYCPTVGTCVDDEPVCHSDADCGDGYFCEYDYESCGGTAVPGASGATDSEAPSMCAPTGVCKKKVSTGCYEDADCGSGSYCDFTNAGCGTSGAASGAAADPAEAVCLLEGVCRPISTGCYSDYDCASGTYCSFDSTVGCGYAEPSPDGAPQDAAPCMAQGVCLPLPDVCYSDSDCPYDYRCEFGMECGPSEGCACAPDAPDCDCWDCAGKKPAYGTCMQGCRDSDQDGACADIDCDDYNASVSPYLPDVCGNYVDDNCNGLADESCGIQCYQDADCPAGWTCEVTKCGTYAEGEEVPADAKCIGPYQCVPPTSTCYSDADCVAGQRCIQQTYYPSCAGGTDPSGVSCGDALVAIEGICCTDADWDYVCAGMDCDDYDASIGPYAAELCDGRDNNCNGLVDEGCGGGCNSDADCATGEVCQWMGCAPCHCPDGSDNCDCGACLAEGVCVAACVPEVCGDGLDNDCNGLIDENCGYKCYSDADCPNGFYCPASYCDASDPDMYCGGGPFQCQPIAPARCTSDADCAKSDYCVFDPDLLGACCMPGQLCLTIYPACEGTCQPRPVEYCADDADCPAGQACTWSVLCDETGICDGVYHCTDLQPACKAVEPGTHGSCKMLLGFAFDGKQCYAEGGCDCGADCAFLFPTLAACENACSLLD